MTLENKYLLEALDSYPYDLARTMEQLDYALSYNEHNATALCLLGRIHGEQLNRYDEAIEYFEEALAHDINAVMVYTHFIDTLLWNEDFDRAEKLIKHALTIKGIDRAVIYTKAAILYESKGKYRKAKGRLKLAEKYTYNNDYLDYIDSIKTRLKRKMGKKK